MKTFQPITGFLTLAALLLSFLFFNQVRAAGNIPEPVPKTAKYTGPSGTTWAAAADSAQQALTRHYWSEPDRYYIKDNLGDKSFHYWWQAHALDVLVDGYERTQNQQYLRRISDLHAGILLKNGGTYLNEYYDDMEWLALACIRAYQATKDEKYLNTAQLLWADIKTGWSDFLGGGISWKKTQLTYKNTPANAPACLLAARLYQLRKNPEDLTWAKKIYAWEKQNLVDPATGLVWDGLNRQGKGQTDKNWKFTYNQGVFIGAGMELFNLTKNKTYLQDAFKTTAFVLNSPDFLPGGIFKSEGMGDGGLFKAIFIRNLTQLLLQKKASRADRLKFAQILKTNGETLLRQGTRRPDYLFSPGLNKPPPNQVDCSVQIAGVALLEALASLQKARLLP